VALDDPADGVCHDNPIIYNQNARMNSRPRLRRSRIFAAGWEIEARVRPWWIAVLCASGCQTSPKGPADAAVDAAKSFDQPIGAACDATDSLLCAGGVGACHAGVCSAFCSAVEFPRCPRGTTEVHEPAGDREICVCARR